MSSETIPEEKLVCRQAGNHLTEMYRLACPACNPNKTVPQLNEAWRAAKLERIADWIRKVRDGDSSTDGALTEIEHICNE